MRRPLVLAVLLAAPALAGAQATGQVLFANSRVVPNSVNAVECDPANNPQVLVQWNPQFINGVTSPPPGGTYIIYGSNTAPNGVACQTTDNTTSGQNIRANVVLNTNLGTTSATINPSALLTVSGLSCANDGQILFICVQGVQGGTNNAFTNFGIATAHVTISTMKPAPPVITGLTPADGALVVSWDVGAAVGTAAEITWSIELEATAVGTTPAALDPVGVHTSGRATYSPTRIGGLVNGVEYELRATAFSKADNPSDPSGAVTGMPAALPDPADLGPGSPWQPRSGSSGGCASGVAGLVGLALLASALALRPRSGRRRV